MIWFTADTHFGHGNIIKHCKRPFKDVKQMDRVLSFNHNSRVKSGDTVFHLGDFCFRNSPGGKKGEGTQKRAEHYLEQLNGRFVFVGGNHDDNNSLKTPIESATIRLGGKKILLVHRPKDIPYEWTCGIDLVFCGHVHDAWKTESIPLTMKGYKMGELKLINVGVDVWNYMPVSINEILRRDKL